MHCRHLTGRILLASAITLIASFLPMGAATAQAPSARMILNVSFKGVAAPGPTFDLVQSVTDFGPGATSAAMTTGTAHYLSVLGGELTVTIDGKAEVVAAGKGVAAPAGAKLILGNAGASQGRLFASTLLPVGAVAEVHQISAAGVRPFATARRTMTNAPALVDITQVSASYDVGYRTANHVMNEFHLMIHTSGRVRYTYLDGAGESYGAGSQAVMYEGRPGWMGNDSQTESSMAWTWVANPGKPLTSAVPAAGPPAPPRTGNAPGSQGSGLPRAEAAVGLALMVFGASIYAARRAWRHA